MVLNDESNISRRKLLRMAGSAAIAGVLVGNRAVWANENKGLNDNESSALWRAVENEIKAYVDQEISRVQTMKKPFSNTDGAVTSVLNTALTYMGRADLVYGNRFTLFSRNVVPTREGKFEIDCSSFVQSCITGTTYENSRYVNDENVYNETFYPLLNDQPIYEKLRGNRMLAHEIGKYCYDNGMSFEPKRNWSNVRVGDLVFLYNSPSANFWNRIGHVMIVSRLNQNGTVTVFESVSKRDFAVVENTYTHAELNGGKRAHLCGRIPLHDTVGQIRCISYDTYEETMNQSRVVRTIKPLKTNRMYTLFFEGDFPGHSYPVLRTGDDSSYEVYSFGTTVAKRPDRLYKVNFYIPDGKLGYSDRIDIMGQDESSAFTIGFAALYEGYVTTCSQYADAMLRPSLQHTFKKSITLDENTKASMPFTDEIDGVLDSRYHSHMHVTTSGKLSSGVIATLSHEQAWYVHMFNMNNEQTTIDVYLTVTQVLK